MKLIFVLLSCYLAFTQYTVFLGTKGGKSIMCEVNDSGILYDESKEPVAQIDNDNVIKTIDGNLLGFIKQDGVYNADSTIIGYIMPEGNICDADKNKIGFIGNDRIVRDASLKTIGYAMRIPKEWAAISYFFIRESN